MRPPQHGQALAGFAATSGSSLDGAADGGGAGSSSRAVVARAKGMTQIANETGLSREQLYRSFSETGNPTLKTTIAVMKALGIALTAARTSDPKISTAA
jgi:probable addiction module antidote protein